MGGFDSKSDYRIFLGYSKTLKAFRVYNSRTLVVEEAIHIRFGKNKPNKELLELDESFADLRLDDNITISSSSRQESEIFTSTQQEAQAETREPIGCIIRRSHPESQIIGDPTYRVQTRLSLKTQGHTALIFEMKPKHIDEAIKDDN